VTRDELTGRLLGLRSASDIFWPIARLKIPPGPCDNTVTSAPVLFQWLTET